MNTSYLRLLGLMILGLLLSGTLAAQYVLNLDVVTYDGNEPIGLPITSTGQYSTDDENVIFGDVADPTLSWLELEITFFYRGNPVGPPQTIDHKSSITDSPDHDSIRMQMYLKSDACVPSPSGSGPCSDAACGGVFSGMTECQTYAINIEALGETETFNKTICVGQSPDLVISDSGTGDVSSVHLNADVTESATATVEVNRNAGTGTYNWHWDGLDGGNPPGISVSATAGTSITIDFEPSTGTSNTYGLIVEKATASPSGLICETDEIEVIATGFDTKSGAADFALVLDVSGSMNNPACNECNDSKLKKLITAGNTVLDVLTEDTANHRMSLTIFARDLAGYDGGAIREVSGEVSAIKSYIDGLENPGINTGWTMMGGGLDQAIARLVSDVNPRNIILITDGQQNRDPSVEEDDDQDYLHITNTDNTDSGIPPSGTDLKTLPYPVHTIGIGLNSNTDKLLSEIATFTGGFNIPLQLSDDESTINAALTTQLTTALNELGSPQIVDYRWRTMSATTATETFPVNDHVQRVEFYLIYDWDDAENLDFVVQKGTQTLGRNSNRQAWRYTSGRGYKRFVMNFPLGDTRAGISPGGSWKLQVSGAAGKRYEVYAVVDDHILDYTTQTGSNFTYAGSNMQLAVDLQYGGIPLRNEQVIAYVFEPGESLSTLLATTALPGDTDFSNIKLGNNDGGRYGYKYLNKKDDGSYAMNYATTSATTTSGANILNESNATAIDLKIGTLMQNPAFREALLASENRVDLVEVSPGRYENTRRVEVTGAYMVVYRIIGDDPKLGGNYERFQLSSRLVETGPVNLGNAGFFVYSYDSPQLIYLRPQDSYGNYLGLGMENFIDVNVTNAPASGVSTSIRGDLQGGYLIQINGMPAGTKPKLDINIGGHNEPTYSGSVDGIYRPFGIVTSIGGTSPLQDMDTLYNPGLMVEAGVEYLFTRKLGVQVNGGYYGFDPSHNVFGISGYLRYDFPFRRTDMNITAGLGGGYYFPQNGDGAFGLSGKLGIQRYLRPNVAAKLDLGYFNAETSPTVSTFATIALGIKWSF